MSFDELLAQPDVLRSKMAAASQTSPLPTDVETSSVDALMQELMMSSEGQH